MAAQPDGWLPSRVTLPRDGDLVDLGEQGEGVLEPLPEGWLLRLRPTSRPGPSRSPAGQAPVGPRIALSFLGDERPTATVDGRPVRLSSRHAEMLALLALHPDGLTADRLATAMYGEDGNPSRCARRCTGCARCSGRP